MSATVLKFTTARSRYTSSLASGDDGASNTSSTVAPSHGVKRDARQGAEILVLTLKKYIQPTPPRPPPRHTLSRGWALRCAAHRATRLTVLRGQGTARGPPWCAARGLGTWMVATRFWSQRRREAAWEVLHTLTHPPVTSLTGLTGICIRILVQGGDGRSYDFLHCSTDTVEKGQNLPLNPHLIRLVRRLQNPHTARV